MVKAIPVLVDTNSMFTTLIKWLNRPAIHSHPFRNTAGYAEHSQKAVDALVLALYHATDEPIVNMVSSLVIGEDRDGNETLTLTVRRRTYERRGL